MALKSGTQLGPYRLEEPIGRGAHALVYRAHDPRLDDHVAVKVLAENHAFDPELSVRFTNEARALRLIRSKAVATVFDVGSSEDGQPYIVLEHADRGSLADRLATRAHVSGPDIERLVDALTEAMTALHTAGLVHRDIKPANLLIRSGQEPSGRPGRLFEDDDELFLGDFGLAKNLESGSGLTVGAGTTVYAAPEQRSEFGQVDARSDVYAATAVVVEAMVGRPGENQTWVDLVDDRIASPLLVESLLDGLAADPADRPPNAREWGDHLLGALDGEALASRAPNRASPRRWLGPAVVAAALALIGLVGWQYATGDTTDELSGQNQLPGATATDTDTDTGTDTDTTSGADQVTSTLPATTAAQPTQPFEDLIGNPGSPAELRVASAQTTRPSEVGWATFGCRFSHMGIGDPIQTRPSPTGIEHHTFFGNTAAGSSSTASSIAQDGDSTCAGGVVNRSSFWLTTVWDPETGQAVPIEEMRLIYTLTKQDVPFRDSMEPIPAALAYTLGNPAATDPSQTPATIVWDCDDDGSTRTETHLWDCPDGSNIFVTFRFPQCWNGVETEPASLVYSPTAGGCPESHPILLPTVRARVYYDLSGIDDSSRLRVATDPPSAELGGLTMAGGYIHGWQAGDFQALIDSCLKTLSDCGFNHIAGGESLALPPG